MTQPQTVTEASVRWGILKVTEYYRAFLLAVNIHALRLSWRLKDSDLWMWSNI